MISKPNIQEVKKITDIYPEHQCFLKVSAKPG